MIIYNVTSKVEKESAEAWVKWMKDEHIGELLATGLFTDCKLCRLLEQDEADGLTYTAQYFCDTLEQYNTYIDTYATEFRGKANSKFGGKYVAFRTLMEII